MSARLPTHLEVGATIRAVEVAGGFATVLQRGEKDAGTLLIVTLERGRPARLWERLPRLDGRRSFAVARTQDDENEKDFEDMCRRRMASDPDCWMIELDVPNPERFIEGAEPILDAPAK